MFEHPSISPNHNDLVDCHEKIDAFLPVLDEMMDGGLVTLERAQVIHYRHREPPQ